MSNSDARWSAHIARETIAQTLCGADGNGFLCDCSDSMREAYLIRADAILEILPHVSNSPEQDRESGCKTNPESTGHSPKERGERVLTCDAAQRAVEWREAAAEIIYDRMRMACKGETPAWVPQGNAIFQDAARVAADKIAALAAQPPAAPVETRTALDVLGDPAGHVDAPRSDGQTIGEFYGDPRPQCSAAIGDAVQPWYEIELTKHWGEGVSSDETRRAAKTALDEIKLLRAVPQPVPQPTWTEEELALAFFEYSACDERRCGWEEPGICDCRNDARRAVHMVKHVLPLSFPFAAPSLSRPHHSSEGK